MCGIVFCVAASAFVTSFDAQARQRARVVPRVVGEGRLRVRAPDRRLTDAPRAVHGNGDSRTQAARSLTRGETSDAIEHYKDAWKTAVNSRRSASSVRASELRGARFGAPASY